jgi:hypothetical protein
VWHPRRHPAWHPRPQVFHLCFMFGSVSSKLFRMARTPRTIELSSISTRFPLETRRWLEQRMRETGRQSLNEVINDLIEDARSWYRLPKPIVEVLERDRKQRKAHALRDYLVNLLLERYVALEKHPR